MKIGLGIGVTQPQNAPLASMQNPSSLFMQGEQGTWYDPSDINLTWRRNLLTYSQEFDNAVWGKSSGYTTITANAEVAPDGTITADKLIANTTNNTHLTYQSFNYGTGSYRLSLYVKAAEYSKFRVQGNSSTTGAFANFDLSTGTYSGLTLQGSGWTNITASILNVGNGWYLCSITFDSSVSVAGQYYAAMLDNSGNSVFTGDGTSGIYIWGAQLELGSTATPYQRITDGIKDYLDYNPLPILYQDAAGTAPVTAVEQPVGLMLDKSKGLVLGPELVTNGGFDTDTDWTKQTGWTISSGKANVSTVSASVIYQSGLVVGKTYKVTYTIDSITSGSVYPFGGPSPIARTSAGTYTEIFTASTNLLGIGTVGAAVATVDNISVRELPGNHAFNPSGNSANFPVLSARYNGLLATENLTGDSWVLGGAASRTATTFTATSNSDFLYQTASAFLGSIASGIGLTASVELSGTGTIKFAVLDGGGNDIGGQQINLTSTPTRYSISASNTATGVNIGVIFRGTGTLVSANLSKVDFRVSNDALNQPVYQRVNTATDYDTVGFKPYLRFNGTNQWLQTNSIDFSYGDKMFVCAGVRKLSDSASVATFFELSANSDTQNGSFIGYQYSTTDLFGLNARGTIGAGGIGTSNAAYTAPVSDVYSGIVNIASSTRTLRLNGSQVATSGASIGTGNYGNYPLYIGARAGSSFWFNGRLYGLLTRGAQTGITNIQLTERYMNTKTAAYLEAPSGSEDFLVTNLGDYLVTSNQDYLYAVE